MANTLVWIAQGLCVASVCAGVAVWLLSWFRRRREASPMLPASRGEPFWRCPAVRVAMWALGSRLVILLFALVLMAIWGYELPTMESLWSKWDAPHYLDIARLGYTADQSAGDQWLFIVFFPLYPALVGGLGRLLGQHYFTAAIAISWAALYGACYGLYQLSEGERPGSGMRAVRLLLLAPTTVFLGVPYTESLFLCLSIFCLLAIRRHKWLWAGVAGFAAALTRNVGVLLALSYGVEYLAAHGAFCAETRERSWRVWLRHAFPVLLIPLGLGVYLFINWRVYGDAFAFMQIQREHWFQQMQAFYLSVGNTVRQVLTGNWSVNVLFMWGPQLIAMLTALFTVPHMMRRLKPLYGVYLLAYLLVILSPSWLLSFPRYWLGAAPVYLYLAEVGDTRWKHALLCVAFALGAVYLTAGYVLGYSVL